MEQIGDFFKVYSLVCVLSIIIGYLLGSDFADQK